MLNCHSKTKIIGLLLLGFFSAFLFISNVVAQRNNLIEALNIQGNRRLTDEEILRHIKTRPGEQFNAKQAQEDLHSLLKLGVFNTSQTRVVTEVGVRGGVNVIFEVMELLLIVELKFDGLRYVSKEELLADLREQKVEVMANSSYQPEKLSKARGVILKYLGNKRGFVDAKVDVTEQEVSMTTIKISFVIDEMPNDDEEDCCGK